MPEPLPRGANFRRAKFLWEIGLDVAGDPTTPYGGDRDMCISIGNGSGEAWRPAMPRGLHPSRQNAQWRWAPLS